MRGKLVSTVFFSKKPVQNSGIGDPVQTKTGIAQIIILIHLEHWIISHQKQNNIKVIIQAQKQVAEAKYSQPWGSLSPRIYITSKLLWSWFSIKMSWFSIKMGVGKLS